MTGEAASHYPDAAPRGPERPDWHERLNRVALGRPLFGSNDAADSCLAGDKNVQIAAMSLRSCLLAIFVLSLGGCGSPWSLDWLSQTESYEALNRTALSSDRPSNSTLVVLRRHGLMEVWEADSARGIAALRADVVGRPDKWSDLFALAELSYLRGRKDKSQPDRLAAAVYAYAFLFPDDDVTYALELSLLMIFGPA